ncbi:MAG: NUDIX hydrolase [Desulfatiglans sp.]|jgi:ADP-ribose pyrophosphatase YjhB (NUDIX family)|nr:NUDIX hydrolase [Desulfatiglans sp.]
MIKREYPESPIIAVGAAVLADQSVLLARRENEPGKGRWSLPGGVVELGEPILDALRREVWEETSLKIEIGGLLGVFDRIVYDPQRGVRYHYVLTDYWGWIASGTPKPGSDISDIQWVPLKKLRMFELDLKLVEALENVVMRRDAARKEGD